MAYEEVSVNALGAILAADINQLQENQSHCPRTKTTQNLKLAAGSVVVTWSSADATETKTITFATDSDWGDPGFTQTPFLIAWQSTRAASPVAGKVINVKPVYDATSDETKVRITIDLEAAASINDQVDIDFLAIGI